jgi:predicted dehydrogenase
MHWQAYRSAGEIRTAVVGYGNAYNMGKAHLEQMRAAGMVPVAVADINPACLEIARMEFPGIATYASLDALLADSAADLVAVITPHDSHARLAKQCLEAGRHVVCEKPLALTTRDCDELIACAVQHQRLLSAYHNRHWDGCITEAVDRIHRRNEIGAVFRIEARMGFHNKPRDWWRSSRSISGGVHFDWGVHFIEYALQLVDSSVTEVSAFAHQGFWQTAWGADGNEDEVSMTVRFANGVPFQLCITTLDHDRDRDWFKICGTGGTYFMQSLNYEVVRQDEGEMVRRRGANRPGAYQCYYDNIAAALTGQEELIITAEWSRRPVHILDLACQSYTLGKSLPALHP